MTAPEAGNTADTLRGQDRDSISKASTLLQSEHDKEQEISAVGSIILQADDELASELGEELTTDAYEPDAYEIVSRDEFDALETKVNDLLARIERHNSGAPHKI